MIFDTHTHIYLEEFDTDRAAVVDRAVKSGVGKMMLPNVDTETVTALKKTLSDYPSYCIAAMGLHPTSVTDGYREALDVIRRELDSGIYHAVGEVGIDLYWDTTYRNQQVAAFEEQLAWAKEKSLPVIIHNRDAFRDTMSSLERVGWGEIVLHSFGGSPDEVKEARRVCDPYFGINGVVTFKNSALTDTVKEIGLSRLLAETDAPYLTPVPYRGKRNEPSYITNTVNKIAEILGISSEQAADAMYKNACAVFGG